MGVKDQTRAAWHLRAQILRVAYIVLLNMHKRGDLRYFGVSVTQSGTRAYTRPIEYIRFGDRGGMVGT